jgi:hypothetical protein
MSSASVIVVGPPLRLIHRLLAPGSVAAIREQRSGQYFEEGDAEALRDCGCSDRWRVGVCCYRLCSCVVPLPVLNAITRQVNPIYAYVPGYVPAGDRYWKWESSARWLTIRFRRADSFYEAFSFSAGPYAPLAHRYNGALAGRTFHISGVTVYWAATHEEQDAWRCVNSHGKLIALSAAQSVSVRPASNPEVPLGSRPCSSRRFGAPDQVASKAALHLSSKIYIGNPETGDSSEGGSS